MANAEQGANLLREHGEGGSRVTFMELFFDLVYVFAVTQLAHLLLGHISVRGAAQTLLLLLAVWRAWVDTAWVTNWFDPNRRPVRLMVLGVMLGSLIMSAALPQAFTTRGMLFAGAYVLIQVGRTSFVVAALGNEPRLRRNFQRILAWFVASGVLWLAGGLVHGTAREALWLAAVVVDSAAPAVGFFTPGLGRSSTADWMITGGHLAERCELFLIVALGEVILITGATFGEVGFSALAVTAFAAAFVGSVAVWWIYFDRSAEWGSRVITSAPDPGRLARSAYTYFHVPMVAGIIVMAVAAELTIADPDGQASAAAITTALGGPALFLAGHALFKWAVSGLLLVSHPFAIIALAALAPVSLVAPMLVIGAGATLVVVAVAGWDSWAAPRSADARRRREQPRPRPLD